jgi:G3E family GTPase
MGTTTSAAEPIPATVLCGFLGAGKTTLLERLLADPAGERLAVLVNDFGAINIDAELIVEAAGDRIALANGCICCSIRDDLVAALVAALDRQPQPDRLLIEASGVSRPLAILEAMTAPGLAGRIAAEATICLIDADRFPDLDYRSTELAIDQAVSSDLLILNKCDIASAASIQATVGTLSRLLPDVRLIRAVRADVPREILLGPVMRATATTPLAPVSCRADAHGCHEHHDHDHHHHHHDHSDEFEAWSWSCPEAVSLERLAAVVRRLPRSLLRAKGVLAVDGDGCRRRYVLQVVGRRHSLTPAPGPPPAESRVVAIAWRGEADGGELRRILDGCRSVG